LKLPPFEISRCPHRLPAAAEPYCGEEQADHAAGRFGDWDPHDRVLLAGGIPGDADNDAVVIDAVGGGVREGAGHEEVQVQETVSGAGPRGRRAVEVADLDAAVRAPHG
jgi:hypothetical protein